MERKISRVIESKLRFLKLTRAGKIRLTPFCDKTLYHALNKFQRNYVATPKNPFNTYFTFCLVESQRLQLEADWSTMSDFPNYDEKGPVTLEDEIFDMKLCTQLLHDYQNRKNVYTSHSPYKKEYQKDFKSQSSHGPTFNRGFMYYKYGSWFLYPDSNIHRDSRPTLPTSKSQQDYMIAHGLNPFYELQKVDPDWISINGEPDDLSHLAMAETIKAAHTALPEEQVQLLTLYESPLLEQYLTWKDNGFKERPPATPLAIRLHKHDDRRDTLNMIHELEKAIRSGNINKEGLRFLQATYRYHRQEIYEIISRYLDNLADPNDVQFEIL